MNFSQEQADLPILDRVRNERLDTYAKDKTLQRFHEMIAAFSRENFAREELVALCRELIPWRKGPFQLSELFVDGEWRSDFKWNRLLPHLPDLKDKKILDIGCNNGYFMFEMARHRPQWVLGIDPVHRCYAQYLLAQLFYRADNVKMELFGVEHVKHYHRIFDVIFSMGIIYHHKHPLEQLADMRQALAENATLILETITIPGEESHCLFPADRYAKMRNVWFVPTVSCLVNWLERSRFKHVEVVSHVKLKTEEQRVTEWSAQQSLEDFLDQEDTEKTLEGYPAPWRTIVKASV